MDGKSASIIAIAGLAAMCGCTQRDPLPFPQYAAPADPTSFSPASASDSFQVYVRAASDLDRELSNRFSLLLRTSYSPGQREWLKAAGKAAITDLTKADGKVCLVPYAAPDSPDSRKCRPEWRMIGRILSWQVEDDCQYQKFDDAIGHVIALTKFGFDLTSGPPSDATLGFVIVDSGRRAITASMSRLSGAQLRRLSEGIKNVYLIRPSIGICAAEASRDMLEQVQRVQDCYRNQNYDWLQLALADSAKEPIEYLTDLHHQPDHKRAEFFAGFAEEARRVGGLLAKKAQMPLRDRKRLEASTVQPGQRPWKRLARSFFQIGEPVLEMNDATCARTQLLILEGELMASVKTGGQLPADLSGFTRALVIDPYSGEPFVYRTDGKDHRLYSVGADLVDDNGETDESFSKPDLTLELR